MEPTQQSPTAETPQPAPSVEPKQKLSTPAAIIIAGVIIAAAVFISGHFPASSGAGSGQALLGSGGVQTTTPNAPAVDIKNVSTAGEPFIGDPNAPVTIAYFSDYQCPYCKNFETTVLPTIVKNYVDTGKVKVVFKDFVFLGPDSVTAALFARAVWSLYPNQYFTWRTAMFNAQDGEDTGFGDRASIEKLTAAIPGIDQAKVSAAVDANTAVYQKEIDADYTEGGNLGVQGTPSVIIGTDLIDGAYPLATYTAALDKVVK